MSTITRGQVEHEARRRLVQTLLCTGPLTARGLAAEVERTIAQTRHHLKVLSRAGVIAPLGEDRFRGDEVTYLATLDGSPEWVYEPLLGEFSFQACFQLMAHLVVDGPLSIAELADRTGLSTVDVARYVKFLRVRGFTKYAPKSAAGDRTERIRGYPEWFRRWLYSVTEKDGDSGSEEDRPFRRDI